VEPRPSDVRPLYLPPAQRASVPAPFAGFADTISLKVSAIFPRKPVQYPGRRTEKSPSRMVCRPASITPEIGGHGPLLPGSCPILFQVRFGIGT